MSHVLGVIQLGDLLPQQHVVLQVRVDVQARTQVSTRITGCRLEPASFSTAGRQLLKIGLHGGRLKAGSIVLGDITFRLQGRTQTLWLNGQVLRSEPQASAHQSVCLRLGAIGFFCNNTSEFSARSLAPFFQAAANLGRHALVIEPAYYNQQQHSGHFAVSVPDTPPPHSKLDKIPLQRWSRHLLRRGQSLQIGDWHFVVDDAAPSLLVEPDRLDFGNVSVAAAAQTLTVRNRSNRNQGVKIVSTVPWLAADPDSLHLTPGAVMHIPVYLTDAISALPSGRHVVASALWLVANRHDVVPVSASVEIDPTPTMATKNRPVKFTTGDLVLVPPTPRLRAEPTHVQFAAAVVGAQPQSAQVTLANEGDGAWQGRIDTRVPWLDVQPRWATLNGGSSITLTLTPNLMATLDAGERRVTKAVQISGMGQDIMLSAALEVFAAGVQPAPQPAPLPVAPPAPVQPPPPSISGVRVEPAQLHWGNIADSNTAASKIVTIRNTTSELEMIVISAPPWLVLSQKHLVCQAGGSVSVQVALRPNLAPQLYNSPQAVQFEGNYFQAFVGVAARITGD